MSLDHSEREVLARLADALIPASDEFPAASAAGVAQQGLDQVLSVRPDLGVALKRIVAAAGNSIPADFLSHLQRTEPAAFGALAEFVPAAYFLNPEVRSRLGYDGQSRRPFEPRADYLEEGLLQSVLDRRPIYRPTPGYDWKKSYDWNYENVPAPLTSLEQPVPGNWDFCGLKVNSPLGIAAGPLLNGKWILYYASLGFDVLTYKTVRSRERTSYALPNLQPVEAKALQESGRTVAALDRMGDSWAVSFGMPSRTPEIWRADIERTRTVLPSEKVLSVSVVATPEAHWTTEELAEDYARCARWALESGADCIEANFSCPNVASADGQIFQQPGVAALVAARLRAAVESKPLLIKIGHVKQEALARALVKALAPHVNALVMVNCIAAKVAGNHGPETRPELNHFFEGQPRGIAGANIYAASLEQISLFSRIIREEALPTRLVGVGGIATAEQVRAHLQAGSHAVQLATAAMLNISVGREIRSRLSGYAV